MCGREYEILASNEERLRLCGSSHDSTLLALLAFSHRVACAGAGVARRGVSRVRTRVPSDLRNGGRSDRSRTVFVPLVSFRNDGCLSPQETPLALRLAHTRL